MTDVLGSIAISNKLGDAWKRSLQVFSVGPPDIYTMYLEGALTGFVAIINKPIIGEFDGRKCVLVDLSSWILLKNLGASTVTPFRVVAQGRNLIEKGFMPHTGLKYPVRSHNKMPYVHIPVEDFKSV